MTKWTDTCPRCHAKIRPGLVGCKPCWYALPKEIRDRINEHYTPRQTLLTATAEYHRALRDALTWFRDNPVSDELQAELEASLEAHKR